MHDIGAVGGPVMTGAVAKIVLARRAQRLGQFARLVGLADHAGAGICEETPPSVQNDRWCRLVAAGHVARGSDPRHRSVVTLELTPSGERLVSVVSGWRQRELSRIVATLPPAARSQLASILGELVTAAGDGYGLVAAPVIPL